MGTFLNTSIFQTVFQNTFQARIVYKQKENIDKNRANREVSQPIRKELSEILISDWLAVQSTIKEARF